MDAPLKKEEIEKSLRVIIDTKEPEAIAFIVENIMKASLERKKDLIEKLDQENALHDKMRSILQDLEKCLSENQPF